MHTQPLSMIVASVPNNPHDNNNNNIVARDAFLSHMNLNLVVALALCDEPQDIGVSFRSYSQLRSCKDSGKLWTDVSFQMVAEG